jgi:hypothetical protein
VTKQSKNPDVRRAAAARKAARIAADPERLAKDKAKRRAANARRWDRIRKDPVRYAKRKAAALRRYHRKAAARQAARAQQKAARAAEREAERLRNAPEKVAARSKAANEARIGYRRYYTFGVWSEKDPVLRLYGLLRNARERAKEKGLPYALTKADVHIVERCPVLGVKLNWSGSAESADVSTAPSLDRIDPRGGYTPGNVLLVSFRANTLKSNGSLNEMRKIVNYLEAFA